VSVVQISGAIARIASTDTLADMIRPSAATRFLSVISSINNIVALLALVLTLIIFNTTSIDRAYWVLYIVALASAVISTMALASIKDVKVARGDESTLTNPLDLISKYKSVVLETLTARRYLAVTSAFHLAVNIPAPFWDYYIMVVIGGDESWVTVKNVTMLSSKALALRILAPLIDSMGARRSLYISMAVVSPIPLLYYNSTSVLELVGTSVYSSIAWTP
jgi:Na+/melibiose symporter-like transporter